jgi:hypothetical protein
MHINGFIFKEWIQSPSADLRLYITCTWPPSGTGIPLIRGPRFEMKGSVLGFPRNFPNKFFLHFKHMKLSALNDNSDHECSLPLLKIKNYFMGIT